jgi:sec-independent protein translocase protein TatB
MFDVAPSEFLLLAVVALVVIGPKDLPRVMRVVGQWVGRARGMARHFRSGIDEMIRQSELQEMEQRWAAENERIMREHPTPAADSHEMTPLPSPATETQPDTSPDAVPDEPPAGKPAA